MTSHARHQAGPARSVLASRCSWRVSGTFCRIAGNTGQPRAASSSGSEHDGSCAPMAALTRSSLAGTSRALQRTGVRPDRQPSVDGQPASRALFVTPLASPGRRQLLQWQVPRELHGAQTCRLGACPTLNPPPALGAGRRRPPISDADRRVRGPRAPRTPLGAHGASSSAASPVRGQRSPARGPNTFGGPPLERIQPPCVSEAPQLARTLVDAGISHARRLQRCSRSICPVGSPRRLSGAVAAKALRASLSARFSSPFPLCNALDAANARPRGGRHVHTVGDLGRA